MTDYQHPTIKVLATQHEVTPGGTYIFGGWTFGQADLACAMEAVNRAQTTVVTKEVKHFKYLAPIEVGDVVEVYVDFMRAREDEMDFEAAVFVRKNWGKEEMKMAAKGTFVFKVIGE